MARMMMAIVFVVLFSAPGFSWTAIQKYMLCPNSVVNDAWGFGTMVA
jgi:hypothetical protein